jgi:acyl-CoA synthetase (AMP-forming)/AMP-acid ligase II
VSATDGAEKTHDVNRRRNLGFFFDQSVARVPDKIAIIDLFGGRERCATYRQLDERMNGVASMLARLGVTPGERVAMLIGNRTEFIEFFFGSMRAGAIPLPLNTRLAADTLEHIIVDAACALAVVDPSSHRDARAIASACRCASGSSSTSAGKDFSRSRRKWQSPPPLSIRRLLPTMRKRSNPIRPDRPAAPRARS